MNIVSGPIAAGQEFDSALAMRLLDSRIVLLSGSVDDRSAQRVCSQLLILEAADPKAPITFMINSGGGSVSSGFAMYDVIQGLACPVRTLGAGIVASMGVTLFLSVPKERRFTLPNAQYMIHQPLISGTVVAPASDIEINAREMIRTKDKLNRLIADATGQPLERVEKDTQRDYWLLADEAVSYGIAGKVVRSAAELT